jgi:arsenate reductase
MKYVLFVCTHNAGRSQMAQAFFERDCTHDCRGESAGSDPARQLWPDVVEVMREVGIDISGRKPKRLSVEVQLHADWAVTMGCGDVCPYVPTRVDDWDIPDPAGRPIDEVREIPDLIERRVSDLVHNRIQEIESDTTSHQWRLARLLPGLVEEFGAIRSPEIIRGCAGRILEQYDDARVAAAISLASSSPLATAWTSASASSTSNAKSRPLSRQNTRVAAQANRLLPSTRAWLRASECISAAAFPANLG